MLNGLPAFQPRTGRPFNFTGRTGAFRDLRMMTMNRHSLPHRSTFAAEGRGCCCVAFLQKVLVVLLFCEIRWALSQACGWSMMINGHHGQNVRTIINDAIWRALFVYSGIPISDKTTGLGRPPGHAHTSDWDDWSFWRECSDVEAWYCTSDIMRHHGTLGLQLLSKETVSQS